IFSLVRAILLKPLPFRDPGRLVIAWDTYLPQYPKLGVSPAELEVWKQQTDIFEESAYFRGISYDMSMTTAGAEALEVHAAFVSPRLLRMLGVSPRRGTSFDEESILLSDKLWRTRFGG